MESELPSGAVTFVFTDLESSTRLYRRIGERFPPLLERHRSLLRAAWAAHEGHEIKTEGDAFLVAFAEADQAVRACAAGQRLIATEPWPADVSIRVRMGVHQGLASPFEGDYVAYAVHQAARVVDAGHGGQIIVSADAATALSNIAPLALRSRGRFQIRDFDEPLELFEVTGEGVPVVDRQLRVRPADGHNLTRPPGRLVDREDEMANLRRQIEPGAIVTMTGPGGIGKTRLAVEFGLQIGEEVPDGVWFVALDALDSVDLVPGAILDAIGASAPANSAAWPAVAAALADRHLLLILDNCEHLLPDLAEHLAHLMARATSSSLLATSRTPLGLRGERPVAVGSLRSSASPDQISPAVALYLDRAPIDGTIDSATAESIGALCAELDGLPLAIELAGARAGVQTPEEMLDAVLGGRPLLKARDPTLPERHRTLDALLEWSYRLLDETSRAVLRRLSVMPGDFDIDTATAAAGGDGIDPYVVPEAVWSLVDQSLIVSVNSAGATRYQLLRTIRRFAAEKRSAEEFAGTIARLSDRFLALFGPENPLDRSQLSRMADDMGSVRAVLDPGAPAPVETKQRLAITVARHHDMAGTFAAGIDEVRRLVTLLPDRTAARVALLTVLADLELRLDRSEAAGQLLDEARGLAADAGLPPWDDVCIDRTAGGIALRAGDFAEAQRIGEAALRRPLSRRGIARISNLLGIVGLGTEDFDSAHASFAEEAACWTEVGNDFLRAAALGNLAEVSLRRGDPTGAATYQSQSLEVAQQIGHTTLVAFSVVVAAQIAAEFDRWDAAVRLQIGADDMLERSHYVLYGFEQEARSALLEAAERALGTEGFERARSVAATMTPGEVLSEASEVLRPR